MAIFIRRANWALYLGRSDYLDRSACIQFSYGFRPDADPGAIQWRRSYCWAWDWLPVKFHRIPAGWLLSYGNRRRVINIK